MLRIVTKKIKQKSANVDRKKAKNKHFWQTKIIVLFWVHTYVQVHTHSYLKIGHCILIRFGSSINSNGQKRLKIQSGWMFMTLPNIAAKSSKL